MAIFAYDDVMLREPSLLVPWKIPVGTVKLDHGHPAVAGSKTIFHLFSPASGSNEILLGQPVTLTGASAAITPRGLTTASGSYATGSAVRPQFAESMLTVLVGLQWTAKPTSGTSVVVSDASNQFLRVTVEWKNPGWWARVDLYMAGSMRTAAVVTSATLGSGDAIDTDVVLGCYFLQPYIFSLAATSTIEPIYAQSSSYGAPINDQKSALLFGKDSANSYPFDGRIKWALVSNLALSRPQIASLCKDPYQILIPA